MIRAEYFGIISECLASKINFGFTLAMRDIDCDTGSFCANKNKTSRNLLIEDVPPHLPRSAEQSRDTMISISGSCINIYGGRF